jgi:hypothetical protein
MKRLAICMFFCLIGIFDLGAQQCYAQSAASSKLAQLNQEQVMKELLNEVRQLRLEVRRMTTNAYRAQAMIARLRLQQEQVNRLTLELSKVRAQISDLESARVELNEKFAAMKKKWEAGMVPESEVNAVKEKIELLNQREPDLMQRESQLAAELNVERGNLGELNRRLDEIERELLTISKGEEDKPSKRER